MAGRPEWGGDTPSYLAAAEYLEDLRWERLHLRVPGYPLFLRLTGSGAPGYALVLVQLLFYAVAVWSLASLLARLGIGRGGVLAFAVLCWLPHVAQAADLALSESLAQSLLMVGFAALARAAFLGEGWGTLAVASATFGYLAITRPVYQATAPTLAFGLAFVALLPVARDLRPRLLRAAVVLPVGTLLLGGGLAAYQRARFGAGASAAGTIALAAQAAAYVEVLPEEEPLRGVLVRHRDAWLVAARHHRPEGYILRTWPELVARLEGDELRVAREVKRLTWEVIRREPRAYALQVWRSFGRYWEWCSFAVPGLRSPWVTAPLVALHFVSVTAFWSLVGSALVASLWFWRLPASVRQRRDEWSPTAAELGVLLLAVAAVLAHMVLQCALGVGEPRYRLPSEPLVFVTILLAVAFLARMRRRLAEGVGPDSS